MAKVTCWNCGKMLENKGDKNKTINKLCMKCEQKLKGEDKNANDSKV